MISCDPGVHFYGIARWHDHGLARGTLERAWLHPTKNIAELDFGFETVVIEKPQKDRRTGRVRLKDVIDLAAAAGRIAGRTSGEVIYTTPKQWKGSLPKDVSHDRIRARLSTEELARVELPRSKKRQLDVWDGVGIGLIYLKRMRP